MSLVFLISLPRSGSTLLQRVLSHHPDISTAAESWFLLALLGWRTNIEVQASYDHRLLRRAISEFMDERRLDRFREILRANLEYVYDNNDAKIFIDKTPRYTLILQELYETFPHAKFVIVVRNPLSIVNSIVEAWGEGGKRWRVRPYFVDLYCGLQNVVKAIRKNNPNTYVLRYEDFVKTPDAHYAALIQFLNLDDSAPLPGSVSQLQIAGQMGDKLGVKKYAHISSESAARTDFLCNSMRRTWARKYLAHIGDDDLSVLGYRMSDLLAQLNQESGQRFIGRDVVERTLQLGKVCFPVRRLIQDDMLSELDRIGELC